MSGIKGIGGAIGLLLVAVQLMPIDVQIAGVDRGTPGRRTGSGTRIAAEVVSNV